MNPTLKNRVKLWWHCLIHLHQEVELWVGDKHDIECYTCLQKAKDKAQEAK